MSLAGALQGAESLSCYSRDWTGVPVRLIRDSLALSDQKDSRRFYRAGALQGIVVAEGAEREGLSVWPGQREQHQLICAQWASQPLVQLNGATLDFEKAN